MDDRQDQLDQQDMDPVVEAYKRDLDLSLIRRNLKLTVEERILAAQERRGARD